MNDFSYYMGHHYAEEWKRPARNKEIVTAIKNLRERHSFITLMEAKRIVEHYLTVLRETKSGSFTVNDTTVSYVPKGDGFEITVTRKEVLQVAGLDELIEYAFKCGLSQSAPKA